MALKSDSMSVRPKESLRKVEGALCEDLLPCKLCGAPAELWQRWVRDDVWVNYGACTNRNDIDGEPCHFFLAPEEEFCHSRKVGAIGYWNRVMGPRNATPGAALASEDSVLASAESSRPRELQTAQLPDVLRDPVAAIERGRQLLATWPCWCPHCGLSHAVNQTPGTDAALSQEVS